jgi:hypothetical protein
MPGEKRSGRYKYKFIPGCLEEADFFIATAFSLLEICLVPHWAHFFPLCS